MCSQVDLNFVIEPSTTYSNPTIYETCSLETDFPKVLGNTNSDIYVLDADYWISDSSFISCGFVTDGFFA